MNNADTLLRLDVPAEAHLTFISDLHLDVDMPHTLAAFQDFLLRTMCDTTQHAFTRYLFILGDLFEYWAGDDDMARGINQTVVTTLRTAADAGLLIYIMHGNRDFLLGDAFHRAAGTQALPDLVCLQHGSQAYLLCHGDTLCTDDIGYQQYRTQVRTPAWQQTFLAKPLNERLLFIEQLRQQSRQETQRKVHTAMQIMDVNQTAVQTLFTPTHCTKMIHGHTHRPAHHTWQFNHHAYERWVLSDWTLDEPSASQQRANALLISPSGSMKNWQIPRR